MKEQEFKFLAPSPENESLRPYRQHISMADSYVLCVERGTTSSPWLWTKFSGKYLLVSSLLRVFKGIKCYWKY